MTSRSPRHRLSLRNRIRAHLPWVASVKPEPDDEDEKDPRWLPWVIGVVVLAALVVGAVLAVNAVTTKDANVTLQGDKAVVEDQRDATAEQASTLADQVAAACQAGGETTAELQRVGACQQAAQVQADPIPVPGPRGPGPTPEEIRGAVAEYLLVHPPADGRAPTAGEIAAAVSAFLTANPPTPGRPPTAAEIADAVETWFRTNPVRDGVDGQNGTDGRDGERGPGPTPEEIQAAVAAELAANPPPAGPVGPAGPTCPAGTTLQQVTFVGGDEGLGCVTDPPPASPLLPPMG